MLRMSQLGITRRQLASWAKECGLVLVEKPPEPYTDPDYNALKIALAEGRARSVTGSVIYFLQESMAGAIKIGTSKHLKKRLDELDRHLPSTTKLLATIEGDREVEWVVHLRFAHARIRGEWFRPVPELLAYIEGIKTA